MPAMSMSSCSAARSEATWSGRRGAIEALAMTRCSYLPAVRSLSARWIPRKSTKSATAPALSQSSSSPLFQGDDVKPLTHLAPLGTLSRNAGEGAPSPQGWVGEGCSSEPLAVYIHWPFCRSKCPYCDFNSHVRDKIDEERWTRALLADLDRQAEMAPDREVVSIFFGGGTPSLMPPETVEALLDR